MTELLSSYLPNIILGEVRQHDGMTVIPLICQASGGPHYLTMAEALEQSLISVTEISQGGSVPELQVENIADLPVLLLDGEELAGAKQNRVLNTTVLLREKSVTVIPVSCTEQGRWSYLSKEFTDSGNVMSPSVRQHKVRSVSDSLRQKKGHKSDQGRVWEEISHLSKRSGVSSPTSAMSDLFALRKDRLREMTQQFQIVDSQCGLLVLDCRSVIGLDIVSSPQAFARLFGKLLASYAMDVIVEEDRTNHPSPIETTRAFFVEAANASSTVHDSIGYGSDHRFSSPRTVGSALVVEQAIVHLAIFGAETGAASEPMSGPSRRRRFRTK